MKTATKGGFKRYIITALFLLTLEQLANVAKQIQTYIKQNATL